MQHRGKWRLARSVVGVLALVVAFSGMTRAGSDEVSLRWAIGALGDPAGDNGGPAAVKRDTTLESGTRLKLLIEPLSAGSVYLILLDADDQIHVLYRESAMAAAGGEPAYIPPGMQWFELDDNSGQETFFLLASTEPLQNLDALLDRHAAADAREQKTMGATIVEEILRINRAHRDFARPVEKPVMIGGQTRNTESTTAAIDRLAVEVTSERFYGKTITIDH